MGGDLPQDLLVDWEEHLQTALLYVIISAGQRVIISIYRVKTWFSISWCVIREIQVQCVPHSMWPHLLNTCPPHHAHVHHLKKHTTVSPTWSIWVSYRTLDLWTPDLWEQEAYSGSACRRAGRNRCRWIYHGTAPSKTMQARHLTWSRGTHQSPRVGIVRSVLTNRAATMAMKRPMNLKYLRWSGLMYEAGLICRQ